MPRLLPRLLDRFEKEAQHPWSKFVLPREKIKSLYKPNRPAPPSLNPANYTKSILLTPKDQNPITSSRSYVYHKSLPPNVRSLKRVKRPPGEYDLPRAMTEEERRWWCNPYLRMISSPLRRCGATMQILPKDLLIRFSKVRLPADSANGRPRESIILIPNGLQHSKFTVRDPGRATHILCDKSIINNLSTLAARIPLVEPRMIHSLLGEQVAHLLRLRVLQELELLGDAMQSSKPTPGSRILRRLTREEWNQIRETGVIPQPNALAVIVVPPLQKDPITGKRPEPSLSAAPLIEEALEDPPQRPHLPTSTLYHTQRGAVDDTHNTVPPIAQGKVPLYNGVSLFQNRPQRAALHMLLLRLLKLERGRPTKNQEGPSNSKVSHAFLLTAEPGNVERGDAAAVALALWRLRMFEEGSSE